MRRFGMFLLVFFVCVICAQILYRGIIISDMPSSDDFATELHNTPNQTNTDKCYHHKSESLYLAPESEIAEIVKNNEQQTQR